MNVTSRLRPGRAVVLGTVAVLALAGTATAGGLITGHDIARNAITSKHVKNGTLKLKDFNAAEAATLKGATGPAGVAGPAGPQGPAGQVATWTGSTYRNVAIGKNTAAQIARLTFDSPAAGFVVVSADFGLRVNNAGSDCRSRTQIRPTLGAPDALEPGATTAAGYADQWINGNLPTEMGAGTFLQLNGSATRVLPVTAGTNTVFLSGSTSCAGAIWSPVTLTATFTQTNPASTFASN